jgi:hypothetical protein
MEGPVSQTPWSPDFLAQTLELLIVHLDGGRMLSLRPIHAPTLQVGWAPGTAADVVLTRAIGRYGLEPRVLHSTSWRHDGEHVVLTYLAVVDPPAEPNANLATEAVTRAELARGSATAAPTAIAAAQVLEHALRHLAWLLDDDAVVAASLPEWRGPLGGYAPEPFAGL